MNEPLPSAISLVMRSYNEAWALEDTLRRVFEQDYAGKIQLIVIDSGSRDGSVDIIKRYQPAHFIQITPQEYVPGKVLNQGLSLSENEWVVFLNSDATPYDRQWLPHLLQKARETKNCGAAFSRQVPRENCKAVFAHDYDRCFGPQRESVHWDHFFSMVSCVVHRPTWEKVPFREDLQYAEDDEWSRRLKAEGYAVTFAEDSRAIHSHNYSVQQSYRRAFGDTKAMAATSEQDPRNFNLHYTVLFSGLRDIQRDLPYLWKKGKLLELPFTAAVRFAQRYGKFKGFHAGWEAYRSPAP